jgi:hypothetical protein
MAPYGDVTANAIMPSANTRLAQIGWRMEQSQARWREEEARRLANATVDMELLSKGIGFDPTDPVHVAEFGAYLASPAAAWINGQTFQVRGGVVEHIATWSVDRTIERLDHGWTAAELAAEMPRMFGAGAKRSDPPPKDWTPGSF